MQNSGEPLKNDYEKELVNEIEKSQDSTTVASAILKTDERVIARVTDGIYRQPGSALRELISNAYDADATRVVIKTDAPRFARISIEDNGVGMSPQTLAHMLLHIGGSAKRHETGKDLGITNPVNPYLSPGGRKLIGKIGIGVFSVAQLTHTFQIITKTKGDNFRTIAAVALKQYSDEITPSADENNKEYESGKVNIWRERASDTAAHGTTIILDKIKPQTRDTLRSREIWAAIAESQDSVVVDEHQNIEPPKYHIGKVDPTGELLEKISGVTSNLPWSAGDEPGAAFEKLVDSVWNEINIGNPNPQLTKIFDYYLQMVWQISLAIPIGYVQGNLFDMDLAGWAQGFSLSNEPKGAATEITLEEGVPVRDIMDLKEDTSTDIFEIFFDELKLSRPIKYKDLPSSGHAIKNPLVFFGKCREEFQKYSYDLSGGPLDFEAYLFWTPRVAPAEHRGSLIRINGASGTGFDSSFMKYQVSEQTRLRQITCEIFIHQGFDSALNIDRESFNQAHPHAVFLTRWLHSALRQLATAQKRVAQEIRGKSRSDQKEKSINEIQKIALDTWHQETKDVDSSPPAILFELDAQPSLLSDADIVYDKNYITSIRPGPQKQHKTKTQLFLLDEKLKAITQVLASFNLLDNLSKSQQQRLLKAIYQILETAE